MFLDARSCEDTCEARDIGDDRYRRNSLDIFVDIDSVKGTRYWKEEAIRLHNLHYICFDGIYIIRVGVGFELRKELIEGFVRIVSKVDLCISSAG